MQVGAIRALGLEVFAVRAVRVLGERSLEVDAELRSHGARSTRTFRLVRSGGLMRVDGDRPLRGAER